MIGICFNLQFPIRPPFEKFSNSPIKSGIHLFARKFRSGIEIALEQSKSNRFNNYLRGSYMAVFRKNYTGIISSILIFSFSGCGSDSAKDVADASKNLARAPGLVGIWKSTCDTFGPLGSSGRALFEFEPLIYRKQILMYADPQCATAMGKVLYTGEFTLGNTDDLAEDARRVDFTPKKLHVSASTESGVSAMNLAAMCGIKDWVLNQERDVTEAAVAGNCLFAEKVGVAQFDIFSMNDQTLKFGNSFLLGSVTDVASRPTKLSDRALTKAEKLE